MSERRTSFRSPTDRAAVIHLGTGEQIECRLRDVSVSGARLETAERKRLPESFQLVVKGDWQKRLCRVAWRKDRMVGVEYL